MKQWKKAWALLFALAVLTTCALLLSLPASAETVPNISATSSAQDISQYLSVFGAGCETWVDPLANAAGSRPITQFTISYHNETVQIRDLFAEMGYSSRFYNRETDVLTPASFSNGKMVLTITDLSGKTTVIDNYAPETIYDYDSRDYDWIIFRLDTCDKGLLVQMGNIYTVQMDFYVGSTLTVTGTIGGLKWGAGSGLEANRHIYQNGQINDTQYKYKTSFKCGDNLTAQLDDTGILTISGSGAMYDYDSFENCAPWKYNFVTTVVIEDGVTNIGEMAFRGCGNLASVSIPASITGIPYSAFSDCVGLTEITIPNNVKEIGKYAFAGCNSLTTVSLGNGMQRIGYGAFRDCDSLTSMTIPASVTVIEEYAFYGCDSLSNIIIPASVTGMGEEIFCNCYQLADIYCEAKTRPIGWDDNWLFGCDATVHWDYAILLASWVADGKTLYTANFVKGTAVPVYAGKTPEKQGVGGKYNFTGWSRSEDEEGNLTFTAQFEWIPTEYTVTWVVDGVETTETYEYGAVPTFKGTTEKASDEMYNYQFAGWDKEIAPVTGDATYTAQWTSSNRKYNIVFDVDGKQTTLILAYGEIPVFNGSTDKKPDAQYSYSFTGWSDGKSTYPGTLPAVTQNVTYTAVFAKIAIVDSGSCGTNLTYTLDSEGTLTIKGSGDLYTFSGSSVPWYGVKDTIKAVVIGDGVTSIGHYAFKDCSSLTSVTIPNSVTSIGSYAFRGCTSLTSVMIPDSIVSIGQGAFSDCSALTSVTISNSVTSIGAWTFSNCSALTGVTIPDSVTNIGEYTFYGCRSLTSVMIPDTVTGIGEFAFAGCAFTNMTIPNSVTTIGYEAFLDCSALKSVTIPDSVTSINYNAFEGCSALTDMTIPDSVTYIGGYAFQYCRSLTDIYCEASEQPSGWSSEWKYGCSNATVHWGCAIRSATWTVDGETVYTIPFAVEGPAPTYLGQAPEKQRDEAGKYSFTCWGRSEDEEGNLTFTAQFALIPADFTVTWKLDEDTIVEGYTENEIPVCPMEHYYVTPMLTYPILGWDSEILPVTENAVYTAILGEPSFNEYTVTWIVDGVTTTDTYLYGEYPVYEGNTDKASTAQYTYTFAGWEPAVTEITGNVVYTAVYNRSVRRYNVTWIFGEETETERYPYGATPECPFDAPEGNDEYRYEFRFTPEISPVTGDTTYTVTVVTRPNFPTVTWIVGNQQFTETYALGATPAFTGSTVRLNDENYTYTFTGWDKAITVVTEDVTYTATYSQAPLGELTGDGSVSIKDVTRLLTYLSINATMEHYYYCDINLDGMISIKDITALLKIIAA